MTNDERRSNGEFLRSVSTPRAETQYVAINNDHVTSMATDLLAEAATTQHRLNVT